MAERKVSGGGECFYVLCYRGCLLGSTSYRCSLMSKYLDTRGLKFWAPREGRRDRGLEHIRGSTRTSKKNVESSRSGQDCSS